jgi:hypothetical protein
MNYADEAIYTAIREADRLRTRTKRKKTPQVRGSERDIIRATTLAWFNNHRPKLTAVFSGAELAEADTLYQQVMEFSHRNIARSTYVSLLKNIVDFLIRLRSSNVIRLSAAPPVQPLPVTKDTPPDFSSIIQDPQMKAILERRWAECTVCIAAGAPLAATVMIGGLLEGLLLARVNREPNKVSIFTASAAPKDKQGNTLTLKDWTLQHYIGVAHELKWITVAARDLGAVLRDYRNYIHPHKELLHGVSLSENDAVLMWEIGKSIARQVLS